MDRMSATDLANQYRSLMIKGADLRVKLEAEGYTMRVNGMTVNPVGNMTITFTKDVTITL